MRDRIIFPRPFAVAVDDLGWNEGGDLSHDIPPGPYRAGVDCVFEMDDYSNIPDVGKQVGARIQCLFILSEMDRENILAKFPTTTHQGEMWNNNYHVNEEQIAIMNFVRDQAAYMEFGLHGIGHEYWESENFKRGEWYNLYDRQPWPEASIREHIQCFKDIMAQYNLSAEYGHSFPESFVPCANGYYWNPSGEYSLGKVLKDAGVKYANTNFALIPELNPPSGINDGGFDHGVHVINRLAYGNFWSGIAVLPQTPINEQETDIIESHWLNWLENDNPLNPNIVSRWVSYYKAVQRTSNRYIAKNTEQLHSQWLYKKYTKVCEDKDGLVIIDNTAMPEIAYQSGIVGNLVLKIQLNEHEHVSKASINSNHIASYFEDQGYGFIYLPPLTKQKHIFKYEVGEHILPLHVYNDGTYNVYDLKNENEGLQVELKVYGTQIVNIRCPLFQNIKSGNSQLIIKTHNYIDIDHVLQVTIQATDMQGSKGTLVIT